MGVWKVAPWTVLKRTFHHQRRSRQVLPLCKRGFLSRKNHHCSNEDSPNILHIGDRHGPHNPQERLFRNRNNVTDGCCLLEKRGYLFILKTCYATTYTSNEELLFVMFISIFYKLIYIWFYSFDTSLHGWYGICLTS